MSTDALRRLLNTLHALPELAGGEEKTLSALAEFLRTNTALTLHSLPGGLYAAYREEHPTRPAIALRADVDAVPTPTGAAHLCGHDGHAAALCGAALGMEELAPGRNVFFLFQTAEETGQGAKGCLALLEREEIGEIYGAHNLPGLPLGQIVTRPGTFACASRGMTLSFAGSPAHAAYPELGRSPARALGRLLAHPALSARGETMCTVAGASLGEKAFGCSADRAQLWLTLRAREDEALAALAGTILTLAEELAGEDGLVLGVEEQDVFPATVNHPVCAEKVLSVCGGRLLEAPMRWSEDFGHYLQRCPGAFFGIGAGEDCPPLHSAGYVYPDALLERTVRAFRALMLRA